MTNASLRTPLSDRITLPVLLLAVVCAFIAGMILARVIGMGEDRSIVSSPVDGLRIGNRRSHVIKELGVPDEVIASSAELKSIPYPVPGISDGEDILLYHEYPWGVLVYVDKDEQRVTRLVLARHL